MFLYITALSIQEFITILLFPKYFEYIFFSVNATFSERFPGKCSIFHSNAGHYKEKFSSFHTRKYWSCVTWIDCNFLLF